LKKIFIDGLLRYFFYKKEENQQDDGMRMYDPGTGGFLSILILLLSILSCKEIHKDGIHCGFNTSKLEPDSHCVKGLEVNVKYLNNNLNHLIFKFNNNLVKEDTVVYHNEVGFLFPKDVFENKKNDKEIIRISTLVSEGMKTYVFKKEKANYFLNHIETFEGDSSIKIEYPSRNRITPHLFTFSTLDSLFNYDKYERIFHGCLRVKYYYLEGFLNYIFIVDNVSWKSVEPVDKVEYNYGNIYLDIEVLEQTLKLMSFFPPLPEDIWRQITTQL
jgi:hypothetical protein